MFQRSNVPSVVSEATRIEGSTTFCAAAQVFGIIDGDLFQQSFEPLQIGRTAWVYGSISSLGPVIVEGRVEGNLQSATKIKLLPTAQVTGVLKAPYLEILPGAYLEGELGITREAPVLSPLKHAA